MVHIKKLMQNKRLGYALIIGALLGVFCIIGANVRYSGTLENYYLFSFWFNRLLMGLVIGLLPTLKDIKLLLIRGVFIGLLISFAFYSSTNFLDLTGFLVGAVYGIIIEFALLKLIKE